MDHRITFACLLIAGALVFAHATAEARIEGSVTLNGKPLTIQHVAAQLHDNAEGVVDKPLVIVFADRPVPAAALDGAGAATAAQQLAR